MASSAESVPSFTVPSRQWSIAGQRGVRVEAAEKGIDAARARVVASGNDLSADAGAAYIALLAAQERLGVMTFSLKELERLREIVAGRRASGMATEYDLLRIDIELESWRSRVAKAEADLVDKQSQLAALLGFSGWKPRASGLLKPLEVRPEAALPNNNPPLIAAKKEEEFALAGVEVARRAAFSQRLYQCQSHINQRPIWCGKRSGNFRGNPYSRHSRRSGGSRSRRGAVLYASAPDIGSRNTI